MIIGYNFFKLILLNNRIGYFKMTFLFINLIYKVIYKKIIMIMFSYEVYVEKSIIEILSRKFISEIREGEWREKKDTYIYIYMKPSFA